MSNPQDPYRPDNADQTPDGPAFGQRSENWSASQEPPASPVQGDGRPWPVYNPQGTDQPYMPQPQYGQAAPSPYGGPAMVPPMAPMGVRGPSRAGAIWTLILGIVMAVIVAPIVALAVTIGGMNLDQLANGSMETTNGGEVSVDDTGVVALFSGTGTALSNCTLTGADDKEWPMYMESSYSMVVGRGIPAGTYTVDCDTSMGASLLVFGGDDLENIVGSAVGAVGWATLVGVAGVVMTIVGIVWLVRRNRARREFIRQQWMGPQGFVQ